MDDSNPAPSWTHAMRRGDFDSAWKISDNVLKSKAGVPCWHLPRHYQYFWNGESLQGKRVLVRCYHGLGDTIQFIRYVPMLRPIAREIILWVQPELIPLLKPLLPTETLLPLHDGDVGVQVDAEVELMELPHVFRTSLDTIPREVPYLHVEPWTWESKADGLKVGLVWKPGNFDLRRAIPFEALAPLDHIAGVQLIILQAEAQSAGWVQGFGMHPGDHALHDFARIVRGLDLLITVDSMPAHLAGALGTPVWNLLHADADWRWMDGRQDSPWYPSMRLFRQTTPGDWKPVIETVRAELIRAAANDSRIAVRH